MSAAVFANSRKVLLRNAGYEAFTKSALTSEDTVLHCHDFWQLSFQSDSGIDYCVNDEIYKISGNDLLVIPPFAMHGVLGAPEISPFQRSFTNITPDFLEWIGRDKFDLENALAEQVKKGSYCFSVSEKDFSLGNCLLGAIQKNEEDRSRLGIFKDITRLLPILRIILEAKPEEPVSEEQLSNITIRKILSYVNCHFTESISLKELAEQFGISVSTLSHGFSKYTGRSLYDYILYRRVMLAAERLREDEPLNEIAFSCGFKDYSNFLRSFHKLLRMSPRDYQKSLRKDAV